VYWLRATQFARVLIHSLTRSLTRTLIRSRAPCLCIECFRFMQFPPTVPSSHSFAVLAPRYTLRSRSHSFTHSLAHSLTHSLLSSMSMNRTLSFHAVSTHCAELHVYELNASFSCSFHTLCRAPPECRCAGKQGQGRRNGLTWLTTLHRVSLAFIPPTRTPTNIMFRPADYFKWKNLRRSILMHGITQKLTVIFFVFKNAPTTIS